MQAVTGKKELRARLHLNGILEGFQRGLRSNCLVRTWRIG
jgi:hypothetical protein